MHIVIDWFKKQISNQQVVILVGILLFISAVVLLMGQMLIPFIAGLIIAYLLDGLVKVMTKRGVPRLLAVVLVFVLFLLVLFFAFFWLVPMLIKQISQLVQQLPVMISEAQDMLMQLPERYPHLVSEEQIHELISALRSEVAQLGQTIVTVSVASVVGLVTMLVYLILVPLLVFFFLKDKDRLLNWCAGFLPRERGLAIQVWNDVNSQLSNYVRGKTWEIIIVWLGTFLVFSMFGLQYSVLLSLTVGVSVVIPYIGAAVVTIPVALVGFFQWGIGPEFFWLLVAYAIIQAVDGNLLAPLLLGEVVNIHPVGIVAAILIFGGLWGFWGVFFAIPLATVVQALIRAWPRSEDLSKEGVLEPPLEEQAP